MGIEKYRSRPRLRWRCQGGAEAVGMGERECGVMGGGPEGLRALFGRVRVGKRMGPSFWA